MPETAFDQEPEGLDHEGFDHEDFAEEAHFWRNQEQQYRRGPDWTPWTEENEYYDQGPTQARNTNSYAEDYLVVWNTKCQVNKNSYSALVTSLRST